MQIGWTTYQKYLMAGGKAGVVWIVILLAVTQGLSTGTDLWLSEWTAAIAPSDKFYFSIYAAFIVGALVAALAEMGVFVRSAAAISAAVHDTFLWRLLRSPLVFFQTQKHGRILNRLSKDMSSIDVGIPAALNGAVMTILVVIAQLGVMVWMSPFLIVLMVPIAIWYSRIFGDFKGAAKELKRLYSKSASPVAAFASETLAGAGLITARSYGKQEAFTHQHRTNIERNIQAYWYQNSLGKWLSLVLMTFGAIIALGVCLASILGARLGMDLTLLGLSLSYALSISFLLSNAVQSFVRAEAEMISVERIYGWNETLRKNPEAPLNKEPSTGPIPKAWPHAGQITVKNMSLRYRPNLPLALDNVSFEIKAGERVGVVGRTGAGKSSLTAALFRLFEPVEGTSVVIDGIETSEIGVHDLRRAMAIIPQEPFLFEGSLRLNLSPTDDSIPDDVLWAALDHVHLGENFRSNEAGLNANITSNGENLSAGERQLLCLARALLLNRKVLVLDEATASVDLETDSLIQETIRSCFTTQTVLVIAHRLMTVMDFDRIIVMDAGHISEYDTPANLLRSGGILASLVEETGAGMAAELTAMAYRAEEERQAQA
ncbi:hypothetical protein KIPB_001654 [Kipferlia bialata]|uniref:ABC transporter ATP-binding protein n=1 Tax=Kipferlia bialata TaxID=797122 RepID=A0A9K3CR37_9EUKA|nr:hypothetical protein KIPB_001654 [Kipferlia bialata]|eukprot:g1654.t1